MSKNTPIEWTDHSWNPWQGCHKVSAGCKNCYMYRQKQRYKQEPNVVIRSSDKTFKKPLSIKKPSKIFSCSWSDFLTKEADPWRAEAWDIIRATPWHTYQILTKRPERVEQCLPDFWPELKNVWLGVSVETQEHIERIVPIAKVKPTVLFISVEPMLEPVNIFYSLNGIMPYVTSAHRAIDWVICGGESGPGYRKFDPVWANHLRLQCNCSKIPFFFKQMAGVTKKQRERIPNYLMTREFPK